MKTILTLLLFFISLIFLFFGIKNINYYFRARNWKLHNAVILNIHESYKCISFSEYQNIKYYFPVIEYSYDINGVNHISGNVGFDLRSIWIPEVDSFGNQIDESKKFWGNWKNGTKINIYINPTDPAQSVIIREISPKAKSHSLSLTITGFILLIISLYLLSHSFS